MNGETALILLQHKYDFYFDFIYNMFDPLFAEMTPPVVIYSFVTPYDTIIRHDERDKIDDIIKTAPEKKRLDSKGFTWLDENPEYFNICLVGTAKGNAKMERVYYTDINGEKYIVAIVYDVAGRKLVSFSDLLHDPGNIRRVEFFFVKYIMPVVQREKIPLRVMLPLDESIARLVAEKVEATIKYYTLEREFDELKRRIDRKLDVRMFHRLALRFPVLLSALGWEAVDEPPAFVYRKKIVPRYAVLRGVIYRLKSSKYHVDEIKIILGRQLAVYIKGYHPNALGGEVFHDELDSYTDPTPENLLELMTRVPKALETVNFNIAYHARLRDYELGEPVAVLDTGEDEDDYVSEYEE